ncbi:hypothetical protein M9Y10_045041 [Tritrichomonas musculus]|uniref:Prenyltransferase alpha-alpha toroid domain-containing protein n=1 Tax=Tritrichomonas musculus TaxID=1915356 RepID=A0ABR2JUH8_9EUKA
MALLCYLLVALTRSAVDAYTMGKEVSELMRFQHQSGGFYDSVREANARDTFRATWVASIYGAFGYINTRSCFRWFQTLRNRDGGAGLSPGSRSTVYSTFCYFHTAILLSPESLDVLRIIEFLKSCFDPSSGLFRDSLDAEPSIEATYYAYELLSRFRDADLNWLQPYVIQAYINDHLNDDHFEFDGISPLKAQLWAGSVAKFVSLTVPYHRISQYVVNLIEQGIKDDTLSNEEAASAATLLKFFGDEPIPEQLTQWFKSSGSLADLFFINQIIVATGEVSKFFEVKVLAVTPENQVIDFEKDGLKYQQLVHPAVTISSLGRFVNPMLNVNITTHIGDETPYSETLKIDYHTGLFNSQRFSQVGKLGRMQIDVVAWLQNELGSPVFITKTAVSRISLPIDISCDAWLHADEIIPVGGEIQPGVNFRVNLNGKLDDIQIHESTAVTFQVTDPSGAILAHNFEEFKEQLEFTWNLPALAIPVGNLVVTVEIGDTENGIHTRKDFEYKLTGVMAATNVEVPTNLKLSDVLRVKMTPAIKTGDQYVPFSNQKFFEGELKDATGETFFPQTASESQKYSMRVSVGGVTVKTVEGEVQEDNNTLVVEFETNVNENLDFATGFKIDFLFDADNTASIPLECEHENFVKVSSNVVYEGDVLESGTVEYGQKFQIEFRLKDQDSGKYLEAGYAYPVICLLRPSDRAVLIEKKAKINDDKYKAKIKITVAVENGPALIAIMIRKGDELVPVLNSNNEPQQSGVTVTGDLTIESNIVEAQKIVVVDFITTYKGSPVGGASLKGKIYDSQNNLVAELPLAQMKYGSRLSWESGNLKGQYKIQISRIHSVSEQPFYEKTITVESPIVSVIHRLPIEGITLALSFIIFVWSIRIRKSIQLAK